MSGVSRLACMVTVVLLAAGCGTPDSALRGNAGESLTATTPDASPSAWPGIPDGVCGSVELGSSEAMGSEAVRPSLTPEPGKPTFTEDDVRAYVAGSQSETTPPLEVTRVEFLPACDVAKRVNHQVSKPDDALVALVTIAGVYGGMPRIPPGVTVTGTPDPNVVTYLILNATTGNVIGRTFGSEPPWESSTPRTSPRPVASGRASRPARPSGSSWR